MGAWGVNALESDSGLDVTDILSSGYVANNTELKLEEMIGVLKEEGFFGEKFEDIDFLCDNSAMALAELYLEWLDTGKVHYDNDDEVIWAKVTAFSANTAALAFILGYLHDIQNEVPDEDDEREIVELWRESDSWEEWSSHLGTLIQRLEKEHAASMRINQSGGAE